MRTLVRIGGGLGLLLVLLLGAAWFGWRASLPQIDGSWFVDGLEAPATIGRDKDGIPVITAESRTDLAFATGFAHGQDRFFQMDLIRRQAAGELSELVGAVALTLDKRNRLHRFRHRAELILADLPPDDLMLMSRYASGVNAGLASLDALPAEYFVLRAEAQQWQPADSLLVVFAMYMQLNDAFAEKELKRGIAHSVLSPEVYAWMYQEGSEWDAPLSGAPLVALPIPGPGAISLRGVHDDMPPINEKGKRPLPGSNNWAVSGALTKNGRALVSNDMHLNLATPNIYYRARLVVTGQPAVDVGGVTLPGAPFVVAGSNTKIAWGYTNSYGDYTDAVLLEAGSTPGTYRSGSGDRPYRAITERIRVKDEETHELVIRETHWGPVLPDDAFPLGDIAVRWIAHDPSAININILRLETAANVAEALDIANTMAMPPQNFVVGDAAGNIGWTIAGKIPARAGPAPKLPVDGRGESRWTGWVGAADYPRIVNPDSGRIWTANSRVVDGDDLSIIGDGGYDLGARARQIRDALQQKAIFDPEDMLAIQYDDRALFLSRWQALLVGLLSDDVVAGDAQLTEYRELVSNWIPRAAPESVGYRLVRAFRLELEHRIFNALMAPVREIYGSDVRLHKSNQFESPLWSLVSERPKHMLPGSYEDWDAFMLDTVRRNIDYFTHSFDGPLSQRRWGEFNTATIHHPLSAGIPVVGGLLNMPADELNGDSNLPKAQGPRFGASERFSVAPGGEANGLMQMPTGASGHALSPFYSAGHQSWVDGTPAPFLPGPAEHTLTLLPNSR